jgi:hypothetical protein
MKSVAVLVLSLLAVLLAPLPARAIPLFAHQYGVTCQKCHTVIPHLTEFGAAFQAYGDRIPGVAPGPAVPLSTKLNLVDSSLNQGDGPNGAGLPKAIVDEIELFTAGAIGSRGSFFVEQYALDGGMPGLTRDAWVQTRLNPWTARIPVSVQAGSFTLPMAVDPETFRESAQHYTIYDQAVGTNPFTFFDPKIGVRVGVGNPLAGTSVQLFAGQGHDRQSGLPSTGTDVLAFVQHAMGPLVLSASTYQGTRPSVGAPDRFRRIDLGLTWNQWGRFSIENVLQTGWDSNCGNGDLLGCGSSGGFTQVRYAFNRRLFAAARYEGTNDSTNGFTRDAVVLLGYGPTERSRVTIEDVIAHAPQTTHTMNLQFTVAF